MKQPVVLKVYHNNKLESVRQFEEKQIVIGREGDVQLELSDVSVSLLHSMIEERDGKYYLSDLGSKSGTFRNNEKVLEEELASGDELTIGNYVIQFFIGVPKAAPAPASLKKPMAAPPVVDMEDTQPAVEFTSIAAPILTAEKTTVQREAPKAPPPPPPPRPAAKQPVRPQAPSQPEEPRRPAAFVTPTKKKSHKTFAPPSHFKDAKDFVKPGKGTVAEVLVLWKERVITTNHFFENGPVFIGGGEDADVVVPVLSTKSRFQFLKIGAGITVCLTAEMTGEVVRENSESVSIAELARQNKLRNMGGGYELDLKQGEAVRVGLQGDTISLMVRYKSETPKPVAAPLMDLTASEVTGIILACVIAAIFFLYMSLYANQTLLDDEANVEEPIRKAVVTFTPPPKMVEEVKEEPQPEKKRSWK